YERAIQQATDAGIRQLLGDLAEEERKHTYLAEELESARARSGAEEEEAATRHRLFLLQVVQPGLAGLMDGSVSTLAPLFAAAFAGLLCLPPAAPPAGGGALAPFPPPPPGGGRGGGGGGNTLLVLEVPPLTPDPSPQRGEGRAANWT